ncbi:DedA family protein [Streptomyces sp. NPDC048254]|uniref:DedA family protein n=1 Tax=Streptomyces sp. NPDC048254 TaxID=3365525 RepID=UPI0037217BB6
MHLNGVIEAAGWWSYVVVFVLTASETSAFVGLLVPGETAVLLGAAVAGRGGLNVFLLAAVVVAGAVTGDSLGYALGRRCARRPARPRPLAARRTARARAFLAHHGAATVLTSKFIGFARTFVPYAAGSSGMPYRRFLGYSALASLVWGAATVTLGYFAGAAAADYLRPPGPTGALAVAAVAALVLVVVKVCTHRRRRRPVTSAIVASGGPARTAARGAQRDLTHSQEK